MSDVHNSEMVPDNPVIEVQPELNLEPTNEPAQEAPAEEAVEEPAKTEAEIKAEAASEPEVQDWREKQINKQHGKIKELQRELAEREKLIAEFAASRSEQPTNEPDLPKPPVQRHAPAKQVDPAEIKNQVELEMRLEALNKTGEELYKDEWNKALNRLVQVGDGTLPDLPWIAKAIEKPEKVLHALGMNPAEALRISELPLERRQAEYFKIAMKEAPKAPKPSAAPAPVDPVKPRSQPSVALRDDMPDADWHELRKKQRAERFAAGRGR